MSSSVLARLHPDAPPHDDMDHTSTHNDDTTPRHLPRVMTPLLGSTTPPPLTPPPRLTASPSSTSSSSSSASVYASPCACACAPASEPMRRSLASIGYARPPLAPVAIDMTRSTSSQGVDGNPFSGRASPLPPQRRASSRSGETWDLGLHLATEDDEPPLLEGLDLQDPHMQPHHTIPLRRRTTPRAFLSAQYDTPRTRARGLSAPPLRAPSSPRADTRPARAYLTLRVQSSLGSIRTLPWRQDAP